MSRRSAAHALLLCLVFPFLGCIVWLRVEKHLVRRAFKQQQLAGLQASDLHEFRFSISDFAALPQWEQGSEFLFQGQMYDVVRSNSTLDSIFLQCWADHKDTRISRQMEHTLALLLHNSPQKRAADDRIVAFLKSLCGEMPPGTPPLVLSESLECLHGPACADIFAWVAPPITPPSPPPWG
jgi:hypothetical protein